MASEISLCPSCRLRVLPNTDGTCPSCGAKIPASAKISDLAAITPANAGVDESAISSRLAELDVDGLYEAFHSFRTLVLILVFSFSFGFNILLILMTLHAMLSKGAEWAVLLAMTIVLGPIFFLPYIAHRLLKRQNDIGLVLAGIVSMYYLLFIIGIFYTTWQMLGLVMTLRHAPVWLYRAKDRNEAYRMAREQLARTTS